jgi:2,3-bisphosphoglycerate-dependent phosphoglycerate mutase
MRLYLVRHGQSFNNTLPDGVGRVADPPLTESGVKQAPLVARHLEDGAGKDPYVSDGPTAGYGITKLFTSAHLRCLQTSEPIGEALDLDPEIWVDVHEECGIWMDDVDTLPGMTRSEIATQFPRVKIPDEIGEDGWWNRPRETEAEWLVRADRVASTLWRDYAETDEHIAIVCHGGFIKDLVSALIADGPLSSGVISSRNTSISSIAFVDGKAVVGYLNRIEHLPPDLVT